jgi:hypothetical protein
MQEPCQFATLPPRPAPCMRSPRGIPTLPSWLLGRGLTPVCRCARGGRNENHSHWARSNHDGSVGIWGRPINHTGSRVIRHGLTADWQSARARLDANDSHYAQSNHDGSVVNVAEWLTDAHVRDQTGRDASYRKIRIQPAPHKSNRKRFKGARRRPAYFLRG